MALRPLAVAAVATVAAVVAGTALTGCGGGDGSRVSEKALAAEAARVCAAGQQEADRLRAEAAPGAKGEAAAKEIDATREALDTQIEGFEDLRGPASTDDAIDALVRHLRVASAGLEELRAATVDDDLTVDEAIRANPEVVDRVNRASARAADTLVELGWLTCVGAVDQ